LSWNFGPISPRLKKFDQSAVRLCDGAAETVSNGNGGPGPPSANQSLASVAQQCWNRAMDKTIRRYRSFEAIRDDEYREWQALSPQARLDAAAELSFMQYQWKESAHDVQPGLQRTLVRVQRTSS
jgi:hypothetical protein